MHDELKRMKLLYGKKIIDQFLSVIGNGFFSSRAAILEQENIRLRLEVSQLKQETAKLRCMVYATS